MADLMTTEEVAEETRIPAASLRWLRHVDRGPRSFKVGRRVMYRREDVEAFMTEAYTATVRGG